MTSKNSWNVRLTQILLGAVFAIALIVVRETNAGNNPVHLSTDWSHRHLVFSSPHDLRQHVHLLSNPRYVQQWVRRNAEKKDNGDNGRWHRFDPNPLHGDWSAYLGISATNPIGIPGTVGAGNYPAKYSFDASSAYCAGASQPDFVVYNTSLAGSAANQAAIDIGTFSAGTPASGQTLVITNGANSVTLTSSSTTNTGLFWQTNATSSTDATNLANAINSNNGTIAVTATANSPANGQVTISANSAGTAGDSITVTNNIALLSFPFTSLVDGATGVPTIVAYDNLYTSCGTVPSTYWAYNTGTGNSIVTSPALSGDGLQVAVIQNTGAASQLVLLKWAASSGTVDAPITLTTQASGAAYRSCMAPCMFIIPFSGTAANDTNSSPFYDFSNDVLYAGDNNGLLHKFTGVFKGTPAEEVSTVTNIWPAVVSTRPLNALTSPVFDDGSGQIFVSDNSAFLYRVNATVGSGTGGIVTTLALGSEGIDDAVLLDATTSNVYVFVRLDHFGTGGRAGICNFSTGFLAGSGCVVGTNETQVSSDNTAPATAFYDGDFDDTFYSSAGGTGNLYACSTYLGLPALWLVPVTSGTLGTSGTAMPGPTLATTNVECSPITEFKNGATDRMFVSVTANSVTDGVVNCPAPSGGCIMSYDITSTGGWGTSKATSATAAAAGGASGIIVDNSSAMGGASQIYFTPLSTTPGNCATTNQIGIGGCAIQADQSDLK